MRCNAVQYYLYIAVKTSAMHTEDHAMPKSVPMFDGCECEHVCHFHDDGRQLSPHGNLGHLYGVKFALHYLREITVPGAGTFIICRDCANDCHDTGVDR
jgi:hypothetical protein